MRRYWVLLVLCMAGVGIGAPAFASSDYGCSLDWKMAHQNLSGCSNMAIMHPGNDTRVNLMLMMQDGRPDDFKPGSGSALFSWSELANALAPKTGATAGDGYPSRCQTNLSGRDAFVSAVRAARRLKAKDRDILLAVRSALQPDCEAEKGGTEALAGLSAISSKTGREFASYIRSAMAFYNGDFDAATIGFSALAEARDDWLRETALYMIARSELNRSQAGSFGQYGSFDLDKIDAGAIANAERGFRLYLKIYPQGQYAGSARGLMRRVYWLGGDGARLSGEYATLLANPGSADLEPVELVEEIDNKLLPVLITAGGADDPILTAMILLYRMREARYNYLIDGELPELTLADVEAVRPRFSDQPRLYEYLLASHAFYVAKQPAEVLRLIPDDARQKNYSYLEFSRQALRGMALDATGDRNALGFWRQFIQGAHAHGQRDAVELALAMNLERGNKLDQVFADGSAVTNQMMRDILLLRSADADLLLRQTENSGAASHERDVALYTWLYKSLTRGKYGDFLKALSLVPADANADGPYSGYQYSGGYYDASKVPVGIFTRNIDYDAFDCPQLKQTVEILQQRPSENRARLCLADYLRIAGFDQYWLDSPPEPDQLGGTRSRFSGDPLSRLELYKEIIADRKAAGDDRAYALYRAIWCYGPSGNNSCGGKEVPTSQRAAWFRQLKGSYPKTRWARQIKYYW